MSIISLDLTDRFHFYLRILHENVLFIRKVLLQYSVFVLIISIAVCKNWKVLDNLIQ